MREFDFSQNLKGIGVVVRASLNVPLQNGAVSNPFRIHEAVPTLERLAKAGARTIVVAHIGREKTDSLRPVFETLKKCTTVPVTFSEQVVGAHAYDAAKSLASGGVLLLENVRREEGETKNSDALADKLAAFGSVYINDAFSDSHRAHASIVGIPKHIPAFAGPAFMKEFNGISPALSPKQPNIAIVGGAKFGTKEPLLRTLIEKYDRVVVAGALAHDLFLAKGFEIGKSLASRASGVDELLASEKIVLPEDVVVLTHDGIETKSVEDVLPEDTIFDIGPESLAKLKPLIESAAFVLWNGPLGNFENGYTAGTESLARIIAGAKGHSVVGGGDTVAAIQNLKLNDKFNHVSTAGGAMLAFIADGTLAGIQALD